MNDLTKQLIKELNSTNSVTESRVMQLFVNGLEAAANSATEDIFEQTISDLESLNEKIKDSEVDTVVKKFKKMEKSSAKKLKDAEKEPGIKAKLQKIKESGSYADPIFKTIVSKLEASLAQKTEPVLAESIIKGLRPYSFDPQVNSVISELSAWVNENRSKILVFNALDGLKKIPNQYYSNLCEKLETAIVEDRLSLDHLKMTLSESLDIPAVSLLLNTLAQFESAQTGGFNLGKGQGITKVSPVIGIYTKAQDSINVLIENFVLRIDAESEVPSIVNFKDIKESNPQFAELVEAFISLGFNQTETGVEAKGKANTVAFSVNENGDLEFKINGAVVEDLASSKIYETLIVETIGFKTALSTVLKNSNQVAQFEFVQRLVNESTRSFAINTQKSGVFVLTAQGLKSYGVLEFHKYVSETFKYDISELYSIQLSEREQYIKKTNEEKERIVADIKKLEESVDQLNSVIESADEDTQDKLAQLKHNILGNIVSLKNEYLTLEESLHDKKKD